MAEAALRDLNLSSQEVSRWEKALRDPKFKELLHEYADEISQPSSREEAEGYLKFLEERGSEQFSLDGKGLIIPTAFFCCKTRNTESGQKVFINVCYSDRLEKPKSSAEANKSGVHWQIPYSLGPMQSDKDKSGSDCQVHDFVIHDEAHELAKTDIRFKKFLVETALEAVEKHRGVCLDRNYILPKLRYKGRNKHPKMLKISVSSKDQTASLAENKMRRNSQEHCGTTLSHLDDSNHIYLPKISTRIEEQESEPSYELVYRNDLDLKHFWKDKSNLGIDKNETTAVILRVDLPDVFTIGQAQLDISDTTLQLHIPGKYMLKVALPLEVDSSKGSAKFDKSKSKLEIILPTYKTLDNQSSSSSYDLQDY